MTTTTDAFWRALASALATSPTLRAWCTQRVPGAYTDQLAIDK